MLGTDVGQKLAGLIPCLSVADMVDDDAGALLRITPGNSAPDAARCARDQRNPSRQPPRNHACLPCNVSAENVPCAGRLGKPQRPTKPIELVTQKGFQVEVVVNFR